MTRVSLVRAGVTAPSADTARLAGVDGSPLATLDLAPPLLATATIAGLRRLPPVERPPAPEVFARAGELFAGAELCGLTPQRYCELQALSAGVPIAVARRSLTDIAKVCAEMGDRVGAEVPAGTAGEVGPGTIGAVWARRGDILGVIAPGNNPGVHVQWVHAAALGYRLVVKPGTKDPFTPARLMAALLAAGVEPGQLSLLPGDHATGDAVVRGADLSLVFGGEDAVTRYAGDRSVILRGPGRSKLLHTGPIGEPALNVICTSVAYDAGMRCTNATAVFTDGDPAELADALAERLGRLMAAPPLSPDAQLPVQPVAAARSLRAYLDSRLDGAVDVARQPDGGVADLGDGSAALRPAVLRCDRTDHPGARVELPFPCVWVLPWRRADGFAPLRDTLALTVIEPDRELAALALREPTIRKVLLGTLPTFSASAASPHDGYLGHDLMEVRGYGIAAASGPLSEPEPAEPAPTPEAAAVR
jgi:Aldehyde dehydrogenase family